MHLCPESDDIPVLTLSNRTQLTGGGRRVSLSLSLSPIQE
jgi:hypothetical protein